ncbi:MAG: TIGR03084 family protein [Rhodospirillaceae bacterium]|jgi:uncharacterized protein (TIGR03084 family)|nr:TIGR03084 family protein [Rhodospirillaceae bacterium]MBT6138171.1 TIGR03084 family protein [Rhodospirillaceae bacterium]
MQEAIDLRDESDALYQLLEPVDDSIFATETLFKGWTVNDILTHLHLWNWAADAALNDDVAFQAFVEPAAKAAKRHGLRDFENQHSAHLSGRDLLSAWREAYISIAERFALTDPKRRVKWAGPDMSVRSSVTARLMETWSHGQAIYDLLGVRREETDRIKSIAVLGILTFGWSFKNRNLEIPDAPPYVRLTAPSGDIWEWNDAGSEDRIEGLAVEFCQVVTQSRNISDVNLHVTGSTAQHWMEIAQCFAGPCEDPPKPGTRFSANPG